MSKVRGWWKHKQRGLNITRLMSRDGGNCAICDEPLDRRLRVPQHPRYITFDHIVPRSQGGLTTPENLRLAHRICNERRGNDPLPEN